MRRRRARPGPPGRFRRRGTTFRPWRKVALLALVAVAAIGLLESGAWGGFGAGGCRVVWVTDGDTVKAWCPGRGIEDVRLLGYDTPEVFSPRCMSEWVDGTIATGVLTWHIATTDEAVLVLNGRDRYGRSLGRLNLDGRNVARTMIEGGHARAYAGGRRAGWCG